jgi:hypothetical protein
MDVEPIFPVATRGVSVQGMSQREDTEILMLLHQLYVALRSGLAVVLDSGVVSARCTGRVRRTRPTELIRYSHPDIQLLDRLRCLAARETEPADYGFPSREVLGGGDMAAGRGCGPRPVRPCAGRGV